MLTWPSEINDKGTLFLRQLASPQHLATVRLAQPQVAVEREVFSTFHATADRQRFAFGVAGC